MAVFEQMGVSCLSVVLLLSGRSSLFICDSCKSRLQYEVLHSYLCVKSFPGRFGFIFSGPQANQLEYLITP